MTPKKETQNSATTTATNKKSKGFTDDERSAMKNRAKELKAEARANKNKADGENDVLEKIAEMQETDRVMAERLHAIIKANAPGLSSKTWHAMRRIPTIPAPGALSTALVALLAPGGSPGALHALRRRRRP